MNSNWCSLACCSFALLFGSLSTARGDGPLPKFTFNDVALHPEDLDYAPTNQLIHPTIIRTEGRIRNPLGEYYLYYAPHKHVAISMAYADSLHGPWTEYQGNPVIEGPSAPDIRWIVEKGRFYMWGHRKNSQTELWTSDDGIHFEYHSVSVKAGNIGTRNATYSRVYEYPLPRYGSKYIMLYSGIIEGREIRCIWLAHSNDAENWVQLKTPLVEPVEGEMNDCYGPAFLRWKDRNFVVYQDHTNWRGGNIKYVEVDQQFNPVGDTGPRYVLIDPPPDPPLKDRYRGGEFYREGDTLYLYSSASKDPRIIVYATAEVKDASSHSTCGNSDRAVGESATAGTSASLTGAVDGTRCHGEQAGLRRSGEDSVSVQPAPDAFEVKKAHAQPRFPSVDELPTFDKLPDPFQFFGGERRVKDLKDWDVRRAEMRRMVEHYVSGPAFPQTHNAQLENLQSKKVLGGKATHHTAKLVMGPDHAIKCTFEYVVPNVDGPRPLLFYICPRSEYAEETIPWRERIIDRGYIFVWVIVGQFNGYKDHGPVKDAFPEVQGNTMMAWVWGINEVIHYLDRAHQIDNLIVTGTSRFGKTAAMAGALNQRIDLTVPVTGGFGVRRFNAKDQQQPASAFAGRCWSNDVFPTFAGQLNKLPVDQHFIGALIAPRGLLAIMGDENTHKNVGHIEAYEALVPVYEWLGAKDKLGLYDHAPRGHGFGEDDFFTILDFADQIFYGKHPESGKSFDQVTNPDLVGFEWEAPAPISE